MEKVEENAGEAVEPKEEDQLTEETQEEEKTPSNDPLDSIEDEDARAEAKRLRAIENRRKKKEEEAEPVPVSDPTNFATKDDLKTLATNEAKKIVAPEVKDVWDELMDIPLGGFDPMDAEAIAKNMAQRFTLYQTQNPPTEGDAKADLTASPSEPKAGGGDKTPKKASAPLPGYKEPKQPADWYPE